MPQQSVFFEEQVGDKRIAVLKTYDRHFAREVFDAMDEAARIELTRALHLEDEYDADDLESMDPASLHDMLWEELLDSAREDATLFSFFVVTEGTGAKSTSVFVSPDWPTAEAFAHNRIAPLS